MNDSVKKIQEMLSAHSAAMVLSEPNRFYLSDFKCDSGCVFITKHTARFFTDFRYTEKAKQVSGLPVFDSKNLFTQINDIVRENNVTGIFIENDFVSVKQFSYFKQNLNAELLDDDALSQKLSLLRSAKSKVELQLIKTAQQLTDETFSYILPRITVGRREKDIMLDMDFFLRKMGSDGVAFDFIVVSGKKTSMPHGVPTEKRIEKGDFVTLDFGAVINGYRSDMTRTVAIGSVTDEQKAVYNTVLKAQKCALRNIKAGAVCRDVDKIARDIIEKDYPDCFGHGLGHSVGIEIHENPSFNTRDTTKLLENTVMTVEPGIYLENKFGVRIEDMVIVKTDGIENITKSPKDLIVL